VSAAAAAVGRSDGRPEDAGYHKTRAKNTIKQKSFERRRRNFTLLSYFGKYLSSAMETNI
jgi:hypothetical protein